MSIGEEWAREPDMENRDPNDINNHLKVAWEEVIGEPDNVRTIDCCYKFSFKCFNMWKTLCYIIATTLCSVIMSSCWGCYFACIAFCHIWYYTPMIKAIEVNLGLVKKMYTIICNAFCEPGFEACSKIFAPFAK